MSSRSRKVRRSRVGMFPVVTTSRVRRARKKNLKARRCNVYNPSVHLRQDPPRSIPSRNDG